MSAKRLEISDFSFGHPPLPEGNFEEPGYRRADARALDALYPYYLACSGRPFLMDIYEPMPFLRPEEFRAFFSRQAEVWLKRRASAVDSFFALHDFQPEHALANLDVMFFGAAPAVGSEQAAQLLSAILNSAAKRRLTRLQSFCLPTDDIVIGLLSSFGFRQEGLLRQHLFCDGKFQDVVLLAKSEGRIHENG